MTIDPISPAGAAAPRGERVRDVLSLGEVLDYFAFCEVAGVYPLCYVVDDADGFFCRLPASGRFDFAFACERFTELDEQTFEHMYHAKVDEYERMAEHSASFGPYARERYASPEFQLVREILSLCT